MATPQLSPGVLVREVDLTVGRAENVLDNIGAIAGPFKLGPVNDPIDITNEQELIKVFGKPISTDAQYEYWMSAASYLSYGGVLKVVRAGSTTLANANAATDTASGIGYTTALAGTSVQEGLGTGFAPDFFSNEANWGAGSYLPSGSAIKDDPLGKIIVSKGAGVPINTLEAWQDLVENTNQAWDYRGGSAFDYEKVTGKKDTGKTKYGTWNGKFNKETAEHNTAAKLAHDKAWLSDMKEWEKTASQKEINEMKRTDKYSKVYGSVYGIHPALKFVGGAMSSGLGIVGPALQGMLTKKGLGNADEFETTLKNMKAGEYKYEGEGGQQSVSEQAKEGVSGGFWGLMSFAKKNPKIFGTLSGDELWSLVSDPDGFWKFYEAALVGE